MMNAKVNGNLPNNSVVNLTNDKNKKWQMELLMERLRTKASQHKTFPELSKSMRMSLLEKRYALDAVEKSNLQKCLDSMQHCIKVTSRQGLVERLESLTRQLGLKFMEDTTGLFISSDMFYLEIVLDTNGVVQDVKVHHECKIEQQSCSELVNCLIKGDFTDFTIQLEGLRSIYQLNAEPKIKSKAFVALQALETDLSNLYTIQNYYKDPYILLLKSTVGLLQKRRGGHPMKLTYFIPPYDLLDIEKKLIMPLTIDLINSKNIGLYVTVILEASTSNKLQILPMLNINKDQQGHNSPIYNQMNSNNSTMLPASFVLKLNTPMPICLHILKKIKKITELTMSFNNDNNNLSTINNINNDNMPLLNLITKHISNGELNTASKGLFVSLPDQNHCYFMTENKSLQGTIINSVPFTEPSHVPKILKLLRQQALFNTLIASCIRPKSLHDIENTIMFEVNALSWQHISITLENPYEESIATVEFNLKDIINIECKIYSLNKNYDNISLKLQKIIQKTLSIPITLRFMMKLWENEKNYFQHTMENGNFNLLLGPGNDPGGRGGGNGGGGVNNNSNNTNGNTNNNNLNNGNISNNNNNNNNNNGNMNNNNNDFRDMKNIKTENLNITSTPPTSTMQPFHTMNNHNNMQMFNTLQTQHHQQQQQQQQQIQQQQQQQQLQPTTSQLNMLLNNPNKLMNYNDNNNLFGQVDNIMMNNNNSNNNIMNCNNNNNNTNTNNLLMGQLQQTMEQCNNSVQDFYSNDVMAGMQQQQQQQQQRKRRAINMEDFWKNPKSIKTDDDNNKTLTNNKSNNDNNNKQTILLDNIINVNYNHQISSDSNSLGVQSLSVNNNNINLTEQHGVTTMQHQNPQQLQQQHNSDVNINNQKNSEILNNNSDEKQQQQHVKRKVERNKNKNDERKDDDHKYNNHISSVSITPIVSTVATVTAGGGGAGGLVTTTTSSTLNSVLTGIGLERRPGIEILPITTTTQNFPSSITITPINSTTGSSSSSSTTTTSSSSQSNKSEKKSSTSNSGGSSSSKKSSDERKIEKKKKKRRDEMGPPEKMPFKSDALNKPVSVSIKTTEGAPLSPTGLLRKFVSSPSSSKSNSSSSGSGGSSSNRPSPKHSPMQNSSPKHITGLQSPKHGLASPKHSGSSSSGKPSMSALKSATNSPSSKNEKSKSSSSSNRDRDKDRDRSEKKSSSGSSSNNTSSSSSSSGGSNSPKIKQSSVKLKQLDINSIHLPPFDLNQQQLANCLNSDMLTISPTGINQQDANKLNACLNKTLNRKGSLSAVIDKLKSAQHLPDEKIIPNSVASSGGNGKEKLTNCTMQTSNNMYGSGNAKQEGKTSSGSSSGNSLSTSSSSKNSEYMVKPSSDGMKITINKTRTKEGLPSGSFRSSGTSLVKSNSSSSLSSFGGSGSLGGNSGSHSPKTHTGLKPGVNSGPASKKSHHSSSSSSGNKGTNSTSGSKTLFQKSNSSGNLGMYTSSSSSSKFGYPSSSKSNDGLKSNDSNSSVKREKSRSSKSSSSSSTSSTATTGNSSTQNMKLFGFSSTSQIPPVEGFMKSLNTKFQIPKLSARASNDDSSSTVSSTTATSTSTTNTAATAIKKDIKESTSVTTTLSAASSQTPTTSSSSSSLTNPNANYAINNATKSLLNDVSSSKMLVDLLSKEISDPNNFLNRHNNPTTATALTAAPPSKSLTPTASTIALTSTTSSHSDNLDDNIGKSAISTIPTPPPAPPPLVLTKPHQQSSSQIGTVSSSPAQASNPLLEQQLNKQQSPLLPSSFMNKTLLSGISGVGTNQNSSESPLLNDTLLSFKNMNNTTESTNMIFERIGALAMQLAGGSKSQMNVTTKPPNLSPIGTGTTKLTSVTPPLIHQSSAPSSRSTTPLLISSPFPSPNNISNNNNNMMMNLVQNTTIGTTGVTSTSAGNKNEHLTSAFLSEIAKLKNMNVLNLPSQTTTPAVSTTTVPLAVATVAASVAAGGATNKIENNKFNSILNNNINTLDQQQQQQQKTIEMELMRPPSAPPLIPINNSINPDLLTSASISSLQQSSLVKKQINSTTKSLQMPTLPHTNSNNNKIMQTTSSMSSASGNMNMLQQHQQQQQQQQQSQLTSFPPSPASVSLHIVKSPVPSPMMVVNPNASPCDELLDDGLIGAAVVNTTGNVGSGIIGGK